MTTIGDTTGRITKAPGRRHAGRDLRPPARARRAQADRRRQEVGPVPDDGPGPQGAWPDYPDLRSSVQLPQAISSGTVNADVEFTLVGPDLAKLNEYADRMIATLRQNPGLVDVDTTLAPAQAGAAGRRSTATGPATWASTIQTIAATLRTLVGGRGRLRLQGQRSSASCTTSGSAPRARRPRRPRGRSRPDRSRRPAGRG